MIPALQGVDLSVQRGELLALAGPSGSGKSTILNLCRLIDPPDSGEIILGGRRVTDLDETERTAATGRAWVNELYAATGSGGWQFSAGKRIVAWDEGYAFRPYDVVQQETRRTLLAATAEGRPLLMAEPFDVSTAWSFVAVNPTKPRAQRGAAEPALAARAYQRDGVVDWHGLVRDGAHTGGSIGAAAVWVANDALELHVSLRYLNAADSLAIDPAATGLVRSNPWSDARVHHATQLLVGGAWTNAAQASILAQAWWDGTALAQLPARREAYLAGPWSF